MSHVPGCVLDVQQAADLPVPGRPAVPGVQPGHQPDLRSPGR